MKKELAIREVIESLKRLIREHIASVVFIIISIVLLAVYTFCSTFYIVNESAKSKHNIEKKVVELQKSELKTKLESGYALYINGEKTDVDIDEYIETMPDSSILDDQILVNEKEKQNICNTISHPFTMCHD